VKIAERSDSNFHDNSNYQVEHVVRFLQKNSCSGKQSALTIGTKIVSNRIAAILLVIQLRGALTCHHDFK
jgi:hypothetical protein